MRTSLFAFMSKIQAGFLVCLQKTFIKTSKLRKKYI